MRRDEHQHPTIDPLLPRSLEHRQQQINTNINHKKYISDNYWTPHKNTHAKSQNTDIDIDTYSEEHQNTQNLKQKILELELELVHKEDRIQELKNMEIDPLLTQIQTLKKQNQQLKYTLSTKLTSKISSPSTLSFPLTSIYSADNDVITQSPMSDNPNSSAFAEYENYIIETLQTIQEHLLKKEKELQALRAEYSAYKAHRKKRREERERAKTSEYQNRQEELSRQVLRLNDQLANYRQTEVDNRQMKRELEMLLNQIAELRSVSEKQKDSKAQSIQYNISYSKELNSIIDEQKLQECRLNQKLLECQRSNEELRTILRNRFGEQTLGQLLQMGRNNLKEIPNLISSTFNQKMREIYTDLNMIKRWIIVELPLKMQRRAEESFQELQEKLHFMLIV